MVVDDGTIPAGLVVVDDDDCSVRSSKREQNNYMHGRTLYTVAVAVF
jgi:TPP-dependent indolepyruvate ferredoxin oxidoreductase alpha subunit